MRGRRKVNRFLRSSRRAESGFTIMELMVASLLALISFALITAATNTSRRNLELDLKRTKLMQSIRGGMQYLTQNIHVGGANLPRFFPAFELRGGPDGESDELIVRKGIIRETLAVCSPIAAGSAADIMVGVPHSVESVHPDPISECFFSNVSVLEPRFTAEIEEASGSVSAYIFDKAAGVGEFFQLEQMEERSGSLFAMTAGTHSWQHDYPRGTSNIYLVTEQHFRVVGGNLEVVENGLSARPLTVAKDIEQLAVTFVAEDGAERENFDSTMAWSTIRQVRVRIQGQVPYRNEDVVKVLSTNILPRNVVSRL